MGDRRRFEIIKLGPGSLQIELMSYDGANSDLRPLVIMHSLDFPVPPNVAFCEKMKAGGFNTLFLRRLGFGNSSMLPQMLLEDTEIDKGAASVTEAAILNRALELAGTKDAILLSLGSSAPVCARMCNLAHHFSFTIFANPAFNQEIRGDFKPGYLGAMLDQVVMSKSGARLASFGFKMQLKRNHRRYFAQLMSRSAGDLQYLDDNSTDIDEARRILLDADWQTLFYHLRSSMTDDHFLTVSAFEKTNAVIIQGEQTTQTIRTRLDHEADRLKLEIIRAPEGYRLAPYVSPNVLLNVIEGQQI